MKKPIIRTPETRAKMSAAKLGKPLSPEHLAALRAGIERAKSEGKYKNQDFQDPVRRAKVSAALTGRTLSEEHKAHMRKPRKLATCTVCGETRPSNIITRYHNDRCKEKK